MKTNYFSPSVSEVAMEPMTVLQATAEPIMPSSNVGDDPADAAPGRKLYV